MSAESHELNSKIAIAHSVTENDRTSDIKLKDKEPFSKMLLSDKVRKGLEQAGFVYPTIIQANAIPIGIAGIDLLVQSKSGTGKTLIYCTVLLELYQNCISEPQSLILVPTREIAVQIEGVLNKIGKASPEFKAISVIGGLEVTDDRKKIQGAKSIVGTPGRVLHLIENQILNTSQINLLVLDEADKLMTQTFHKDITKIQGSLPIKKQFIACSATFIKDIDLQLTNYMNNPLLVSTEKRATLLVGVKQFLYEIPEQKTSIAEMQSKISALKNIFSKIPFKQCLTFTSSQSRADSYRNLLEKEGWHCEIISGAQNQKTRLEMFKRFQDFKTRILISTDLMSRGIDSANVNLVINLELPDDGATYLHRIGRAGRFGTHGIAVTFIASNKDRKKFSQLLDSIDPQINIFKFPQESNNLLDFSNSQNEFQIFNIHDYKENSEKINSKSAPNSNGIIDNKTYNIEYEKDTYANKMVLTETLNSDHIIPSSNTIDDASSIAVDSDFLQSNSSMGSYEIALNPTVPPVSLLEVLIDSKKSNLNDRIDLFEDYKNTLEHESVSEKPIARRTECDDWKTLLVDFKKPNKIKNIFSEYEKFVQNKSDSLSYSSKTNDCELSSQSLKSQIPIVGLTSNQIVSSNLVLDIACANLEESSPEIQIPHFPSPKENNQSVGDCSTECFSRESSSGFGEKSSGIVSSSTNSATVSNKDESTNGSESYYTTSPDTYENAKNSFNSDYNNIAEYETSSSANSSSLSKNQKPKQFNNLFANDPNLIYQNAYARWTDLYWNQMTCIQDYVKFSSYVVKQNPH